MRRTYLDWAAAAPVAPDADRAFRRALPAYGNPSSSHAEGREARAILEDARTRIARCAGVKADAVLFTAGATDANALAILGQVGARIASGSAPAGIHVLYAPSAHASTRGSMDMLRARGVEVEALEVRGGSVDLARLRAQVRPETVLVALEAVCGETGTRFDTRGVRQALDEASKGREPVRLHVDASQLPLVESFALTRLSADTLTLDSQKVGGVRGIGALLAPRPVAIEPLMRGGGQERGLRPGTPSAALAAGFAAALEACVQGHASFPARAALMRARLLDRITRAIPGMDENGGTDHAPHILNVSLAGRDTDYLAALLDEAGFAVSTRSACATDEEGSAAVLAYTGDDARAASTLRISWGPQTRARDLERFADALVRAVRFLDANTL